jgi:hypothetical protein
LVPGDTEHIFVRCYASRVVEGVKYPAHASYAGAVHSLSAARIVCCGRFAEA